MILTCLFSAKKEAYAVKVVGFKEIGNSQPQKYKAEPDIPSFLEEIKTRLCYAKPNSTRLPFVRYIISQM